VNSGQLHSNSLRSKGGHQGKNVRQHTLLYKSSGSVQSYDAAACGDDDDEDDDFEEQYIVSGPSRPVQFKSGHPTSQGETSAKYTALEDRNLHGENLG